ncbi:hypothetical protein KHP62_12350 [Rhodobacteraceae bacterium NNCM2]|nr:hypothetical protein [Coraliihabitans acroporae]
MIRELVQNLGAGLSLARGRAAAAGRLVCTTGQLLALVALHAAMPIAGNLVETWPPAGVFWYGVGLVLLPIALTLALVEGAARLMRVGRLAGQIQVAVLATGFWIKVTWLILANFMPWKLLPLYSAFLLSVGTTFLWAIAGYQAMRLIGGRGRILSALFGLTIPAAMIGSHMIFGSFPVFR